MLNSTRLLSDSDTRKGTKWKKSEKTIKQKVQRMQEKEKQKTT